MNNLSNIITLEIEITNKCNFNCSYCCAEANKTNNELNFKDLILFLKYLFKKSSYSFQIIITGGEPLLYKKLNELLFFLNFSKLVRNISLLTNLSKINYKFINKIPNKLNFILSSIHLEYYDYYLKNINFFKEIIQKLNNKNIHVEFNVLLKNFDNLTDFELNELQKLKKILQNLNSLNSKLLTFNAQFITSNNDLHNISIKNKIKYQKILNIKFNSYYDKFNIDFELFEKNNFNFKGWYCKPKNYMIKHNGDIVRDCGSFPIIGHIKNLRDAQKINIKPIICQEDYCNPQISGEIERWKK